MSSSTACRLCTQAQWCAGVDSGFAVVRYHSLAICEESLPAHLEPIAWTCGSHQPLRQAADKVGITNVCSAQHPPRLHSPGTASGSILRTFLHFAADVRGHHCVHGRPSCCHQVAANLLYSLTQFQQICYSYLELELRFANAVTMKFVWLTMNAGLTDACRVLQLSAFTGSCP